MTYVYNNEGTCSVRTEVELNPDHTIEAVRVLGGCNGNLKGISSLLKGMKAEDAIVPVSSLKKTGDSELLDRLENLLDSAASAL